MPLGDEGRLAVLYEHPEWFEPLFTELDRRSVSYEKLLAHEHRFDPANRICPYPLVINRMSPSAYTRRDTHGIFYTLEYLAYLKEIGANVVNGYNAYVYEISKARQIGLLRHLDLSHPRTRVINHPSQAAAAAEALRFPVLVKPNVGGSGAKIARFDAPEALRAAASAGTLDLGVDHVALVQEYLPAEGNSIVRVEMLDGEFLYAIRLQLTPGEFNLCPADYCEPLPSHERVDSENGAAGISTSGTLVEAYSPPADVVEQVRDIVTAAHMDLGGVEYLVDSRDGKIVFYDINVLSNFVAEAPNVVGFDPFSVFVDYLLDRASGPAHAKA